MTCENIDLIKRFSMRNAMKGSGINMLEWMEMADEMDKLKFKYAELFADLFSLMNDEKIDLHDQTNAWVLLFEEAREQNHKILTIKNKGDVRELNGAYDLLRAVLDKKLGITEEEKAFRKKAVMLQMLDR